MIGAPTGPRGPLRYGAALAAAALLWPLVGCTDAEEVGEPTPVTTTSSDPATAPATRLARPDAPWQVRVVQISSGVPKDRRAGVARSVQATLDTWVDGGFLTGYPREEFGRAFVRWTAQAAGQGRADRDITTNAAMGSALVDLVATQREANLFVFASHGTAGGATARVLLRFLGERSDGELVALLVRGELRLTRVGPHWRVFGYDLTKAVQAR